MNIVVDIESQQLRCISEGRVVRTYSISTAANGTGQQRDSECTPLGMHMVRAKIGAGAEVGTVFVARRPTGEIYSEKLSQQHPDRDWILTRILWLSGLQPGFNCGGEVDTMDRFIYIHGSPDSIELGRPGSHGCVRMSHTDVVELFDLTPVGAQVNIVCREPV